MMRRRILAWITERLPKRTIEHYGNVYLERFYLCGRLTPYFEEQGAQAHLSFLPTIYIHHFLRGDLDRELHNHPSRWSLAFMLINGYVEERILGSRKTTRVIKWVNLIRHKAFHRITLLLGEDVWTLIVIGRRASSWGFLSRDGTSVIPSREFIERQAQDRTQARVDRAGHALLALISQIDRLRKTNCPTMRFGHTPGEVVEVVRDELREVNQEIPTSRAAQLESADVLAASIHLCKANCIDPIEALEHEERKIGGRIDHIEGTEDGTWKSAKEQERARD